MQGYSEGCPQWYNFGYTEYVKTAVSLPDELFALAEAEAKRLRVSRSELYARAISEYVRRLRDDEITAKLNEVYSGVSSELDPTLMRMQLLSLPMEKW